MIIKMRVFKLTLPLRHWLQLINHPAVTKAISHRLRKSNMAARIKRVGGSSWAQTPSSSTLRGDTPLSFQTRSLNSSLRIRSTWMLRLLSTRKISCLTRNSRRTSLIKLNSDFSRLLPGLWRVMDARTHRSYLNSKLRSWKRWWVVQATCDVPRQQRLLISRTNKESRRRYSL